MKIRGILEGLSLIVLAVVLYQFQTTILLFVIPVVVLFKRQEYRNGVYGALAILVGIFLVSYIRRGTVIHTRVDLLWLDLTYPLSFLLGVIIMESPKLSKIPAYARIGFLAVLAGVLGIPLIQYMWTDPSFDGYLRTQVEGMIQTLNIENGGMENIVRLAKHVFVNTYAVGYYFTFLASWVVGSRIGLRTKLPSTLILGNIFLPHTFIWGFLLAWFGVLVGLVHPLGWVSIFFWNAALVASTLYGLQGIDILRFLIGRMERLKPILVFILVFFLFIPGINILMIIGVPLLGVSELWIQYRRTETEEKRSSE